MRINNIFQSLLDFCENEHFKGWDPFDGLNSKFFQNTQLRNYRFFRLLWIQFFKIFPINLRKVLIVPKEYNSKGLGLFLSGFCNKYLFDTKEENLRKIQFLIENIFETKILGYSGSCWGYNFDWQSRAFFQPKGTPTVVATSFVANALLDAYEILKEKRLLEEARSACNFVLNDLNRTYDESGNFCFSYSPLDRTQVFNATALGSKLLSRVYSYLKEEELKIAARKSIEFCLPYQNEDGSWPYGTLPYHKWVDSFHTGYMVECICDYQKYTGDQRFKEILTKSLNYYLCNFFEESGIPKYFNNKRYPVDIHSPAQLVVTLFRVDKLKENKVLVDKVLNWVFNNMWDKRGFFYYQKRRFWTSKIPYMRWAQAWMFYSLSYYLREFCIKWKRVK